MTVQNTVHILFLKHPVLQQTITEIQFLSEVISTKEGQIRSANL
jgi:hypothetical protein